MIAVTHPFDGTISAGICQLNAEGQYQHLAGLGYLLERKAHTHTYVCLALLFHRDAGRIERRVHVGDVFGILRD
jgi:hypothetical protein